MPGICVLVIIGNKNRTRRGCGGFINIHYRLNAGFITFNDLIHFKTGDKINIRALLNKIQHSAFIYFPAEGYFHFVVKCPWTKELLYFSIQQLQVKRFAQVFVELYFEVELYLFKLRIFYMQYNKWRSNGF